MATNEKINDLLAELRTMIRSSVQSGLQSHTAQDYQRKLCLHVDRIELELRSPEKPAKEK